MPGMLSARRYVRTQGELPEYLTLYEMTDLSVLSSAPYFALLNNPSEWSRSMRPSFRGFLRVCCARVATRGGGIGTCLATLIAGEGTDLSSPDLADLMEKIATSAGAIAAAHIIKTDAGVPPVPFKIDGASDSNEVAGALLFEGFDEACLIDAIDRYLPELRRLGLDDAADPPSFYRLTYALNSASLGRLHPRSAADLRGEVGYERSHADG